MKAHTPNHTRRDFIKSTAIVTAAALLPSSVNATPEAAKPQEIVGIQAGAVSFLDEGTEQVLDTLQERGAVNTLFLATFSYGRGTQGRQVQREPLPDHGKQEYDLTFHGGNFATPHAKYYTHTSLKQTKAPDYGDYDLLAEVVPRAHRRGMKVYAFYEDRFREGIPGMADLREVDWQGQRASYMLCPLHPDYLPFSQGPGHGTGYNDQIVIEARAFLRAIETGQPVWPTFADGLAVSRVIHAARASAATGQWQEVPR